jgi:hypothetical protein
MRTTIRLDDPLLRKAKARAIERGISLNEFIADAVRAAVQRRGTAGKPADLPTFAGGALLPGVDLDDSSALLDLMEGRSFYATHRKPGRVRKVAASTRAGAGLKSRNRR